MTSHGYLSACGWLCALALAGYVAVDSLHLTTTVEPPQSEASSVRALPSGSASALGEADPITQRALQDQDLRLDAALRQISALEASLEALSSQVETLLRTSALAAASDPQPSSESESDRAEAEQGVSPQQTQERLAELLRSEPEDPVWEQEIAEQFERAVAESKISGSQITEIDCGSTFCKVSARHEKPGSAGRFPTALLQATGIARASFSSTTLPDGTLGTTIYLIHKDAGPDHPVLK